MCDSTDVKGPAQACPRGQEAGQGCGGLGWDVQKVLDEYRGMDFLLGE